MQRRLIWLLFKPSVFSGFMCGICTIFIVLIAIWEAVTYNSWLSSYLLGSTGIGAAFSNLSIQVNQTFSGLLAQSWVYYVVMILVAVFIALIIYVALQQMSHFSQTISDTLDEAQLSGGSPELALGKVIGGRLILHTSVLLVWIFYTFISISAISSCTGYLKLIAASQANLQSYSIIILITLAIFAMLHLHTIFFRLFLLRPRVFGGKYEILEALE